MKSWIDNAQKLELQGRFFVLSIGIDAYPKMGKACSTAVAGANAVEQALCSKYGFELIETYPEGSIAPAKLRGESATLAAIEHVFKSLRQNGGSPSILDKEDSLVIYLAGEGGILEDTTRPMDQRVHFATSDTRLEEERIFLDYATLKRWLKEIPAMHILLISDHCHSGAVDATIHYETTRSPLRAQTYESRSFLSSGLDELTDDLGENGLSTFTGSLVEALECNEKRVLSVSSLFRRYYDQVSMLTGQRPACRDLSNSGGHQEGEFFLFLDPKNVANPFAPPPFGFGLIDPPLGEKITLADHLSTNIQKYFGWDWFSQLKPYPDTGIDEFNSERELLNRVILDPRPLVLAGAGGVGKTRLALELCRLAKSQGWDSLFIESSAERGDLEQIIAAAETTGRRLILVIDYLEQSSRSLSFDRILEVTARSKADVRVIATCRASHLKGPNELRPKRLNEADCFLFQMPSEEETPYSAWVKSWIEAAYKAIDPTNDNTASRVPAIAVIRKFSRGLPDGDDLPEGPGWMTAMLMRSVAVRSPTLAVSRSQLARFLACFPMPQPIATEFLLQEPFGEVFRSFEIDGWIAKQDGREAGQQQNWVLGHDLLCDFILRDDLTESQELMSSRLEAARKFGINFSCEVSVATSLGRVANSIIEFLGENEKLSFFDMVSKQFDQGMANSSRLIASMLEKCLIAPSLTPDQKLQVILATPRLSNLSVAKHDEVFTNNIRQTAYLFEFSLPEYSEMIVKNLEGDFGLISRLVELLEMSRSDNFGAEDTLSELHGGTKRTEILGLFIKVEAEKNLVRKSKILTEILLWSRKFNSEFSRMVYKEALKMRGNVEDERRLKIGLPTAKILIGTYATD